MKYNFNNPDCYANSSKLEYRKRLYDFVRSSKRPCQYEEDIAILDTSDAFETIYALQRGFSPEQITVVNKNVKIKSMAAWKAVFTKRLKDAGFENQCHIHLRRDFLDVVREESSTERKYPGDGYCRSRSFILINFDSCSPITGLSWLNYVSELAHYTIRGGVFGLTILAGREPKGSFSSLDPKWSRPELSKHQLRYEMIDKALNCGKIATQALGCKLHTLYRSGRVPMIQVAYRIVREDQYAYQRPPSFPLFES